MGYTHYWRRAENLSKEPFTKAADQIKQIGRKAEALGVRLAGPKGTRAPSIDDETIAFNGDKNCGHPYCDIGNPHPTEDATAINNNAAEVIAAGGPAFSGPYVKARTCGGNCAGEQFLVDRNWLHAEWHRPTQGMYAQRCATNYK